MFQLKCIIMCQNLAYPMMELQYYYTNNFLNYGINLVHCLNIFTKSLPKSYLSVKPLVAHSSIQISFWLLHLLLQWKQSLPLHYNVDETQCYNYSTDQWGGFHKGAQFSFQFSIWFLNWKLSCIAFDYNQTENWLPNSPRIRIDSHKNWSQVFFILNQNPASHVG